MRKTLSAILVLVGLFALAVPTANAAGPNDPNVITHSLIFSDGAAPNYGNAQIYEISAVDPNNLSAQLSYDILIDGSIDESLLMQDYKAGSGAQHCAALSISPCTISDYHAATISVESYGHPGYHQYKLRVNNVGAGSAVEVTSFNGYYAGADSPFGYIDSWNVQFPGGQPQLYFAGWVNEADREAFTGANTPIHVYVDGVFVGGFTGYGYRSDVGAAYPAYGNYQGFGNYLYGGSLDSACVGTSDHLQVFAVNYGSGSNLTMLDTYINC